MTAPDPADPAVPPTAAPERTALAWQRTALAALALGVALLRLGTLAGSAPQVAAAAAALLAAVALAVAPVARGEPDRWRGVRRWTTAVVTACIVAAGVLAVGGALLA